MIVFIAAFPTHANMRDGFFQRVAWIDGLVEDQPRIYLDISLRRHWVAKTLNHRGVVEHHLNGFLHLRLIASLLKSASMVYVHSVYNALKVVWAFRCVKMTVDVHGVVPEELRDSGQSLRSSLFSWVETIVAKRSEALVHVSETMRQHFFAKYQRSAEADSVIPIFPSFPVAAKDAEQLSVDRDMRQVIYAGGTQHWQNIALMFEAASMRPEYRYVMLSGEFRSLQQQGRKAGIRTATYASVPPQDVAEHYLRSAFGFILRDDVLVNTVACPTKLVEYLHWGVIPIVLSAQIGDFPSLGYSFLTLEDFCANRIPNVERIAEMRKNNWKVAAALASNCSSQKQRLRDRLACC